MSKSAHLLIAMTLFTAACGEQSAEIAVPQPQPQVAEPSVLARVNGEAITRDYLDVVLLRTLGKRRPEMTAEMKEKLLDSAIKSRAMALLAEQEVGASRLEQIAMMTEAYREELLAQDYLRKHANPAPVTSDMIEQFYRDNPRLFGAVETRQVIMIKATVGQSDSAALSGKLNQLRDQAQWDKKSIEALGNTVRYQQFSYTDGLLGEGQDLIVQQLKSGETSVLHMQQGEFYLFRVLDISSSDPKPLSDVSGQVRQFLMPQLIAEAVEQVSDEMMSKVTVEKINTP